jgi:hypothetical protein
LGLLGVWKGKKIKLDTTGFQPVVSSFISDFLCWQTNTVYKGKRPLIAPVVE